MVLAHLRHLSRWVTSGPCCPRLQQQLERQQQAERQPQQQAFQGSWNDLGLHLRHASFLLWDSMKTYKNLYSQICTYDNLELAFKKARKRKTTKGYVIEFEADLESNLMQLKKELETFSYRPAPLTLFTIRDPKTRKISASHFRDRVVHHALCNIIEPIFERNFIYDSFANRKGKGTHAAILRFEAFIRKVTQNGRLSTENQNTSAPPPRF